MQLSEVQKYRALELETGHTIEGFFYEEAGYWKSNGVPDLNRPVKRYYIVDENGAHREAAEDTLEPVHDASARKEQQLTVEIVDGLLIISIGADVLCHATEYGVQQYFQGEVEITDNAAFSIELLREISSEEEDGTTVIHKCWIGRQPKQLKTALKALRLTESIGI